MDHPAPAYEGEEPFVFISYSHLDEGLVYREIRWLQHQGIRVWYDTSGIGPGSEWNDEIARAIKNADCFLYLVTPNSVASEHCRRELNFAQSVHGRIVVVHLEETELPDGLRLSLDNRQAILKHRLTVSDYHNALTRALLSGTVTLSAIADQDTRSGISTWIFSASAAMAVLFALAGAWWFLRQAPHDESTVTRRIAAGTPSVAVLPFVNMSDDRSQDYFADGISEEILSLLARNPKLKVISRSSAFSFKGRNLEVPAIADQLGVEHVLDGSVRKSGNTVRVTAQLIEASTDRYVWSESFDRDLDDVFAIQTEIATRVAEQLNVALLDLKPPTYSKNSEAYPLFSQARQILGLSGTLDDTLRAKSLLERALEIDPTYVPAWTEMARAYSHLTDHGVYSVEEGDRLADEARAKALALDPDDAVTNAWIGWAAVLKQNDFKKGVQYFKKGLSLDPTNLDILRPAVPLLFWFRKYEDSLELAEYVVERDPLCVICIGNLASSYMKLGRYGDASRLLNRGLTLSPDNMQMRLQLGESELLQHRNEAALTWFEELPAESSWRLAWSAMAMQELGRAEELKQTLATLEDQAAYVSLAVFYARVNDADSALKWLRRGKSAEQDWIAFFATEHLWATDVTLSPKWQEFLADVGLSSEQIAELELEVSVPR